jgi:hypothetical protein
MRKYDELYAAIKKDRKKSAPTFNQELLKMFLQGGRRSLAGDLRSRLIRRVKNGHADAWMS